MRGIALSILLSGCMATLGAHAEAPARVYTNADLARYGVPAAQPRSPETFDPEAWESVQRFIDRQHARIDADRRHELEQRRVAVEEQAPAPDCGRPYYGSYLLHGRYPVFRAPAGRRPDPEPRSEMLLGSDAFPVRTLPAHPAL